MSLLGSSNFFLPGIPVSSVLNLLPPQITDFFANQKKSGWEFPQKAEGINLNGSRGDLNLFWTNNRLIWPPEFPSSEHNIDPVSYVIGRSSTPPGQLQITFIIIPINFRSPNRSKKLPAPPLPPSRPILIICQIACSRMHVTYGWMAMRRQVGNWRPNVLLWFCYLASSACLHLLLYSLQSTHVIRLGRSTTASALALTMRWDLLRWNTVTGPKNIKIEPIEGSSWITRRRRMATCGERGREGEIMEISHLEWINLTVNCLIIPRLCPPCR